MKMSKHCKTDRLDRMVYIATTIGWGNVILEQKMNDRRECLTDTGVILIKALKEDFLITAYIASIDRATALYHSATGKQGRLPVQLYNTICKNKKYHDLQNRG